MAFHSDFWVAVATAAPVIGLAHVVAIERPLRTWWRFSSRVKEDRQAWRTTFGPIGRVLGRLLVWAPYASTVIGIGLAAMVFWRSLGSLSAERDTIGTGAVEFEILVSMVLLLFAPLANAAIDVAVEKSSRGQAPDDRFDTQ